MRSLKAESHFPLTTPLKKKNKKENKNKSYRDKLQQEVTPPDELFRGVHYPTPASRSEMKGSLA